MEQKLKDATKAASDWGEAAEAANKKAEASKPTSFLPALLPGLGNIWAWQTAQKQKAAAEEAEAMRKGAAAAIEQVNKIQKAINDLKAGKPIVVEVPMHAASPKDTDKIQMAIDALHANGPIVIPVIATGLVNIETQIQKIQECLDSLSFKPIKTPNLIDQDQVQKQIYAIFRTPLTVSYLTEGMAAVQGRLDQNALATSVKTTSGTMEVAEGDDGKDLMIVNNDLLRAILEKMPDKETGVRTFQFPVVDLTE
jgi:hypothetical protein